MREEKKAASAAVAGPSGLDHCPITGRKFWGNIEHPELGLVATYGGPFDTYTIPAISDDGELRCERFDQDAGHWVEGGEPAGWLSDDQPDSAPTTQAVPQPVAQQEPVAGVILDTDLGPALVQQGSEDSHITKFGGKRLYTAAPAAQVDALAAERTSHAAKGSRLVRVLLNESPGSISNTDLADWVQYAQQLLTARATAAPVAQGDAEDAARYHWLRERVSVWRTNDGRGSVSWFPVTKVPAASSLQDETDAAIDAARSQAKEGGV